MWFFSLMMYYISVINPFQGQKLSKHQINFHFDCLHKKQKTPDFSGVFC